MSLGRVLKRVLIGRAEPSDRLGATTLRKRVALPVFATDAVSSVAYAVDEILLVLGPAGGSLALTRSWPVALAVAAVMAVVVLSYRQSVRAYPHGGGDYDIVTRNIGPRAGLVVASALLVDYVLTVAVSVSASIQQAATTWPWLVGREVLAAVVVIVLLTGVNVRGIRESARILALPVYLFLAAMAVLVGTGVVRHLGGTLPQAESAALTVAPAPGFTELGSLATGFLLLRAFASGNAALTGVETISSGVPAFRSPRGRNAAATLAIMGAASVTMLLSVALLARWTGVQMAEYPATQLLRDGVPVGEDHVQHPVIGQVAEAVFAGFHPAVVAVTLITALLLVVAANSAFNGFPVLASTMAHDDYLPRQLRSRGDRLALTNGILALSTASVLLVVAFGASPTRLIDLYVVGVFVAFTLSQVAMVRHWNHELRVGHDHAARGSMRASRTVNAAGAVVSGLVLLVALGTKTTHGAFWAVLAMVLLFVAMSRVRHHYDRVNRELAIVEGDSKARRLPSRVHAIVLIARLNKPAMRALAYARATRPTELEAVTVAIDPQTTAELMRTWDERDFDIPLKALASPFRDVTAPVVEHVRALRSDNPRELVVVYVPEYVLGRWYQDILHNQNVNRLKRRLHYESGVMVCSVPWQLRSAQGAEGWLDTAAPVTGNVRGPR